MKSKARLQVLCELHNVQGGTIFQYNMQYEVDFISMPDDEFTKWVHYIGYIHNENRYTNLGTYELSWGWED